MASKYLHAGLYCLGLDPGMEKAERKEEVSRLVTPGGSLF